jgi:ribosomal protein L11 methyltransferase
VYWKIFFTCEAALAQEFSTLLEDHVAAVSWSETTIPDQWVIEATTITEPDPLFFNNLLKPFCRKLKIPLPVMNSEKLPETDWLKQVEQNFPARQVGRYHIHGSHILPSAGVNDILIEINAATAFGSGEHETTTACLLTLDDLAAQGKLFNKMLDMGCGSGILAIAMAKTWQKKVIAADNDPESVRVTDYNAKLNKCKDLVHASMGDGFNNREVQDHGLYDLVVANILANPLIEMASALSHSLVNGGITILSGLLTSQREGVIQAYQQVGMTLLSSQSLNNWEALLLQKQ